MFWVDPILEIGDVMNGQTKPVNRLTVLVFLVTGIIAGGNPVGVRFSNSELPPFWGGALRFALTALLFWLVVWLRKINLPDRKDIIILSLNGFFSIGVTYCLFYWGLVYVESGFSSVIISLTPLFTLVFAVLHGIEKFSWRNALGGFLALVGIAIALQAQLGTILLLPVLALIIGAAVSGEGNIILKLYTKNNDPWVSNALMMTSTFICMALASILFGETMSLPSTTTARAAVIYLVLFGSFGMFYLYVWLMKRWSASATSYVVMLLPIVATIAGFILAGETVTLTFVIGGILVMIGVWIGAIMQS